MARPNSEIIADRKRLLGPNFTTFYEEPVHLVKGDGVWVWDAEGRKYLDCYNNVPHVGHCHPRVVEAIASQAATLNTHTRYLHEGIVRYADRLTALCADPLDSVVMACTGSEANDIALRMAEAVTGKRGIIATDHTYHGNTTAVALLSRTNVPKTGDTSHIRFVTTPDSYRGVTADAFAASVKAAIAELKASEHGFSALILCPFFANEGFPDLPYGYLDETAKIVKEAGGVIIADEVQPGFGRLGSHMWGYERIGILPDVVTLGKPMGNGHPVAAVVTSAEILATFHGSFRYFNTFGGNPVSCAAANAVLDVIEDERLMAKAQDVGAYAKAGLQDLQTRHYCIGDVRGAGLFFGIELVTDRATKAPATELTTQVVNALRHEGIILSKLGVHYNTLKMRPNLQFKHEHLDVMIETLDRVLGSVEALS